MRPHVILAVLKRNLMSYFSGVLGYLFIVVFVIAAAWCAFSPQFFTNNLANLDQLTINFPYLLLFIIPAITMTAWADEKRQGTDELLFTLPARDVDILLGKYLSLVVIYAVALFFSMTQLCVLGWYADPDWGLLITTYFGYWLAGSALISAGMFASVLTGSVTVAFVVGAVICAVPVFVGSIGGNRTQIADPTLTDRIGDFIGAVCSELSLVERLREFTMGVMPVSGLIYFGSLIGFFLFLNNIFIGRRHWRQLPSGMQMSGHSGVRIACLFVILASLNLLIGRVSEAMGLRFDLTAEKLYTLSKSTRNALAELKSDNPVTIQVYMSPQVPREYVGQQTRLKGLLRQYDRIGGNKLDVRFVEVTPFSEQADEAKHQGIEPNRLQSDRDGRLQVEDVYLGAVVSSHLDQVTIPFFELGTAIEYELTRSVRTVAQKERLTVGILKTDAKVAGGFDMGSMRSTPEWRMSQELKKQYKVKEIGAEQKITESVDVLIAVLPSALPQAQFDNFVDYVKSGKPTVIFDDPLPIFDPSVSPSQQKRPQGGGMFGGMQPPEQRAYNGSAKPLVDLLGIEWVNDKICFDLSIPHPQFADLIQPELIFITPLNGNPEAINTKHDVTTGLQEVLTFFPGRIRERTGSKLKFEALLRTGGKSGLVNWSDLIQQSFFGMQINRDPSRIVDDEAKTVAAQISGEKDGSKINVIYCADADMISDQSFQIAQGELHGLRLDNVKFVLNCVDVVAGHKENVELRSRRPEHRALKEVQKAADKFRQEVQGEREAAEKEAKKALETAKSALDAEIEKINKDENLSQIEKAQKAEIAAAKKQRELDVKEANIKQKKELKLNQLKAREQRDIRRMESGIRFWAVLLPPIPSIILGILVLSLRLTKEQQAIEEIRRLVRKQ